MRVEKPKPTMMAPEWSLRDELENLYVVDTRFFPSTGAVNPALTAMANAIRVGEHMVERLS